MSINAWYKSITPERLEQLIDEVRNDYDAVEKFLHPEERSFEPDPDPHLWTERNWEGLHSLLSFGKWKRQSLLAASLLGGKEIGNDRDYGPVRYLTPPQVRSIAAALRTLQKEELENSFDASAMNAAKLPPVGEWRDDDFSYLWETFMQVRDFFQQSARLGDAMLLDLG